MEIIINPICGLANRMRSIASGVCLCRDKNIEIKEIVWPVNADLYCRFDELFEPLPGIKLRNVSSKHDLWLYDVPRKKNLYLSSLFQIKRYCSRIIDTHTFISDYVERLSRQDKPLLIRSGVIFYDFTPEFYRSLFHPHKRFIEEADQRLNHTSGIIGLHIRRTDNSLSKEKSPTSLFVEAVNDELRKDPNAQFYLATDDDEVKTGLTEQFGRHKIICSESTATRSTQKGIKEALIELLCLSKCKKIYGSYWSSYSEAAAMLGNIPLLQLCK